MAKRFLSVAAGTCLLAIAYVLGASYAQADWSGTGTIVGAIGDVAWNALGEGYSLNPYPPTPGWNRNVAWDLPVPVSEIRLLAGGSDGYVVLVSDDDRSWFSYSGGWTELPPLPGGPISVESRSFGRMKATHR